MQVTPASTSEWARAIRGAGGTQMYQSLTVTKMVRAGSVMRLAQYSRAA